MAKKRRSTKRKNYHLRELPSWVFREYDFPYDFREFCQTAILPRIKFKGYKIVEKQEVAMQIAHNLVLTGLGGAVVSDSRNTGKSENRMRIQTWDAFIKAGLAQLCLGSEASETQSRYRATGELLELNLLWKLGLLIDTNLERGTESDIPSKLSLIYIHTGKIDPVSGKLLDPDDQSQPISMRDHILKHAQRGSDGKPDPRAIENGMNYWRGVEDLIERINRTNLSFSWVAYATDPETGREHAFQPNPCLRQIHVGEPFRGMRLYSWSRLSGQNLSKAQRQEMEIDCEQTAELDFSGYQTRMLYHRHRIDPRGDVYRPELIFPKFYGFSNVSEKRKSIVRDFIKRATNICWNVRSKGAANSSVGKLLAEHPERTTLEEIIYQIEETTPSEIIDRIQAAHPDLEDEFFTGIGMELMTTDGNIMLHILNEFVVKQDRPALAIHDALVVRASDAKIAKEVMAESYRRFRHFAPVISRVY